MVLNGVFMLFMLTVPGLLVLVKALDILVSGQVHWTSWNSNPIRGTTALILGIVGVLTALVYLAYAVWMWAKYV